MLPDNDYPLQTSPDAPASAVFSKDSRLTVHTDFYEAEKPGEKPAKWDSKKARFLLLAAAGELWPDSRIPRCFRQVIPGRDNIEIKYNQAQQKPRFANLVRCMVAACPVCGPWDRLQSGLVWSAILNQSSYHLVMVTLTIAHDKAESFDQVYSRLKAASRRLWSGRWYQGLKNKYWLVGKLSSLEVTWSPENGYHPHYHVILVADSAITPGVEAGLFAAIMPRWRDVVARAGGFAADEYGVDVQAGDHTAAEYLAKMDQADDLAQSWGIVQEATLTDYKRGRREGRSPLQLLADYALKGDQAAGAAWLAIETGLKGQTRLKASRGLYEALGGPDQAEKQAAEQTALTESEVLLLSLNQTAWRVAWSKKLLPEIYEIACENDAAKLKDFLRRRGVPFV